MPYKGERCPKCHSKAKQIKFLDEDPLINEFTGAKHGLALFRCKICRFEFKGWGIQKKRPQSVPSPKLKAKMR